MIARYTRREMGQVWSIENKFSQMLQVEITVAAVQAKHKMIPPKAAREIAAKAKFNIERIEAIESETKHDVIAFVTCLAESVGESGRFIHYGLTSSDVLDTALSLQVREAGELLLTGIEKLSQVLAQKAKKYANYLCAGRTHGMHAEITSFGVKLCGYLAELHRHHGRLERAFAQMAVGKLSGAVGTYSSLSPTIEADVCKKLRLLPETQATQVIPRDRLAEVFAALGLLGGFMERVAVELRHLQRTEVAEVVENFSPKQKGSSAMPHKKNPISGENITGLARLLRSYVSPALENMALWHERDISHSSVERVILPDAMIAADYALHRLTDLLAHLYVDRERMRHNMELSRGQLFSSQVLLLLVRKGLSREEAYKIVQRASHELKPTENLKMKLLKDNELQSLVKRAELETIFKDSYYRDHFAQLVKRVVKR